jgi:hypothetical protein
MPKSKPTVCIDFDGVIAQYERYHPYVVGEPMPGAVEWVKKIAESASVYVLSARASHPNAVKWIEDWLTRHGIPFDKVSNIKPPAVCYIDDRAIPFDPPVFGWQEVHEMTLTMIEGYHDEKPK